MSSIAERAAISSTQELRRSLIARMTDHGIWKEQAEYIMDTLFSGGRAPSFADFLDQHADIARVLWPVKAS